jgi:hypothetical protein
MTAFYNNSVIALEIGTEIHKTLEKIAELEKYNFKWIGTGREEFNINAVKHYLEQSLSYCRICFIYFSSQEESQYYRFHTQYAIPPKSKLIYCNSPRHFARTVDRYVAAKRAGFVS